MLLKMILNTWIYDYKIISFCLLKPFDSRQQIKIISLLKTEANAAYLSGSGFENAEQAWD